MKHISQLDTWKSVRKTKAPAERIERPKKGRHNPYRRHDRYKKDLIENYGNW